MKITIDGTRYELPKPAWSGIEDYSTGITLRAIYIGRARVILKTHSIWDNGRGGNKGVQYRLATAHDLTWIEHDFGESFADRCARSMGVEAEQL